jgi:hypothetical protein
MGLMRGTSKWQAWLLKAGLAVMALAPNVGFGQEPGRADPVYPLPIGHDRMETGGFFVDGGAVLFRQTNPLRNQPIAFRGFTDSDGSFTGVPGTFVGSHAVALDARDAGGPGTYQPGFKFALGWRFSDGSAIDFNWTHLMNSRYIAGASLVPQNNPGSALENTFLSAPVFNFPNLYAGPAFKLVNPFFIFNGTITVGTPAINNAFGSGHPFTAYGIWNGAEQMTIDFIQRFDQAEVRWREPIFENEYYRCYGLVGPRLAWQWERFTWRTTDVDFFGQFFPANDVAVYSNVVSNRMYGVHIGTGHECYLGYGFAVGLEAETALFIDSVKEIAKYELGAKDVPGAIKRVKLEYTVVPEFQGKASIYWYPIEAVQVHLSYDLMAFINTVASPNPVSFNYGGLDPAWVKRTRTFDGFEFGVSLSF